MRGEHSGRREPVEYPSVSGCETYLCLKCEDRFISKVSLEEHIKEEHRKKEVRCIICGFKFKSTFVLNEHIHKEHPLPRRVQNFGNFRIHDGEVEFSDSEDDEDKDYERHRAEETEVSGSDDDEGTEDEEEDDYVMQRQNAEDEKRVEEEAEDEEIGQEQAEGSENAKDDEQDEEESSKENETVEENDRDSEVKTTGTKTGRFPCNECDSVFSFPYPLKLHIKNNHVGKLKCDECNFRSNILRKLEDHEREMHGPVDGKGGWKNSFWEAFCQSCLFYGCGTMFLATGPILITLDMWTS